MLPIVHAQLPAPGSKGSYLYQRTATHWHRGIDLRAPRRTPVLAAAPGVVTHAGLVWRAGYSGYGRCVVLRHAGGARTLYAHLETVDVEVGQELPAGGQLGTVGGSSFTKAGGYVNENLHPHLHFEVAANPYPMASEADRLDPVRWLEGTHEGELLTAQGGGGSPAGMIAFALGIAAWLAVRGLRS